MFSYSPTKQYPLSNCHANHRPILQSHIFLHTDVDFVSVLLMFQEDMLSGGTESDYSMEKNSLTHSSMPVLNQSNNRSTTVNTGSTASPNSDQVHLSV